MLSRSAPEFEVKLDDRANRWLGSQPAMGPVVIAYLETRCCGGGRVCDVRVRMGKRAERYSLIRIGSVDGRELMLDRRIAQRLPLQLVLTVRGIGPFQALSLDLKGEEWGRLLYD